MEVAGLLFLLSKTPYASVLFGDTAEETFQKAQRIAAQGFRAAKFGWGPFGLSTVEADCAQLDAARKGLGEDGILLIDAGTVWNADLNAALARLKKLKEVRATWLEEPFVSGALSEYHALSRGKRRCGNGRWRGVPQFPHGQAYGDYAGLKYVQIDAGRIGGISVAKDVADYAATKRCEVCESHLHFEPRLISIAATFCRFAVA